jgi:hypothetical protein
MAGQADRTASINKQIEAANKRHEEALKKQAARLLPAMDDTDMARAIILVVLAADMLVLRVAEGLHDHQVKQYKRALAGKAVSDLRQDDLLLHGDAIQKKVLSWLSWPWYIHSIAVGQNIEITRATFTELVNQRLTTATEQGLIPPCHYDGWGVYLLSSEDKSDPA